jgi:pilus assembly protein Flp/PilA
LSRFWRDESGATAIEYGLMVALIALAIVGSISAFSDKMNSSLDKVSDAISTAIGG